MNVQLHHAVTDITGVTGRRIIRAIVAGEQNREAGGESRRALRASEETLRAALTGHYRAEHALRQAVDLYDAPRSRNATPRSSRCSKR